MEVTWANLGFWGLGLFETPSRQRQHSVTSMHLLYGLGVWLRFEVAKNSLSNLSFPAKQKLVSSLGSSIRKRHKK